MSKKSFRDIEKLLSEIDTTTGREQILAAVLDRIVHSQGPVLGIVSGRLYRERTRDFVLIASVGEHGEAILGKSVDKNYPIIHQLTRERSALITHDAPGFDSDLESQFTAHDYAAIVVGRHPAYILSFGIQPPESEEELLVLLETIRASVGLKLKENMLANQLRQARTIQMSLLPHRLNQLPGFELAAATFPAEEVGGDVFDVQSLDPATLAIAVADASGHGLPAALQARDVVIGLRMGVARDQKLNATIERLNLVIHKSGLSSRFISLFYCELDETGDIFYVNCGHCPPLLLNPDGKVFELQSSGPVLGPLPKARFRRSYADLRPGEYLVMFTDGVTERKAPGQESRSEELEETEQETGAQPGDGTTADPEEFGRENLVGVCRENLGRSAREMVEAIETAVREFGGGEPFADDVTILVARRLPASEYEPKRHLGAVPAPAPAPRRR